MDKYRMPDLKVSELKEFENLASYVPLREAVYNSLKTWILNGNLKPGHLLSENKIANTLSVSRTPVREAIRLLEKENFVSILPGRKVVVSTPTVQDIEEIYDIRIMVECEGLKKITPDQKKILGSMEQYIHKADELLKEDTLSELGDLNTEFHLTIISALKNKRLEQFIDSLHDTIYRFRLYTLKDENWARRGVSEHKEIIKYLKEGDNNRAIKTLEQHLIHGKHILITQFTQMGGENDEKIN